MVRAVILGMGAPNRCRRDGSAKMCAIALCREYGLIRLYPLTLHDAASVWSVYNIELTSNPNDNRRESWQPSRIEWVDHIDSAREQAAILDACMLPHGDEDPIDYQNRRRASIAVVKPHIAAVTMAWGPSSDPPLPEHADAGIHCQKESLFKASIHWGVTDGKTHTSHLSSQEAYAWFHQEPHNPYGLFANLHLIDPGHIHCLLLGNMLNQRTTWLAVHVFPIRQPVPAGNSVWLQKFHGDSPSWPYSNREAVRAKAALNPQLMLSFSNIHPFEIAACINPTERNLR